LNVNFSYQQKDAVLGHIFIYSWGHAPAPRSLHHFGG